MATTGIFYFDGPSFADATSAFTDASLLTFAADEELLKRINDFRFENRIETKSEAIRLLVEESLKKYEKSKKYFIGTSKLRSDDEGLVRYDHSGKKLISDVELISKEVLNTLFSIFSSSFNHSIKETVQLWFPDS